MKIIPCLLLAAFTVSVCNAQTTLDFETGDLSGWKYAHAKTAGNPTDIYTSDIVNDSTGKNRVARIHNPADGAWSQLSIKIAIPVTDTVVLRKLSARILQEGQGQGTAGIAVRLFTGKQSVGFLDQTVQTAGWQKIALPFFVYPGVDSIALFAWVKGGGNSLFDDFSLESVQPGNKMSDAARTYLDTALHIIGRNALYRDSVDFDELKQYASMLAAGATQPSDCYPAIKFALAGLGDRHSSLFTPADSRIVTNTPATNVVLPKGQALQNGIAYLQIPAFHQLDSLSGTVFADSLQSLIKTLDNPGLKGWIIDNRNNTGGNVFPMLLGLGPILGDGIFQKTIRQGTATDSMGYHNGVIRINDAPAYHSTTVYRLKQKNVKIAVLTGPNTASSGESVVLAFKGRKNSRSFGEPTQGLTTYNSEFLLSDGAILFVCAGKQSDRYGNAPDGKLVPDQAVSDDQSTTADEVIQSATKWILEKN